MTLESPRPKFHQLADLIRAGIERGEYAPGTALPSEDDLAETHNVTRPTVNRALRILRAEGLVTAYQGRGTIVRPIQPILRNGIQRIRDRADGGARGAFDAEVRGLGMTPRTDTTVSETPAPATAAGLLGIEPGTSVLARDRRMYADEVPVQLAVSYLPLDIAAGTQLAVTDTGPGGSYSRLADLGHAPARFAERITVRNPDPAETAALGLDDGQRVYVVTRTAADAAGRTVEATITVMPIHLWELAYDWPAES